MVTGSVAAAIYGEPRNTNDVDLILLLPSVKARQLASLFPLEEFYCPPVEVLEIEANREANGHFNLIHHETGFKADVYLMGNDPLHLWAFRNWNKAEIDGREIAVAPVGQRRIISPDRWLVRISRLTWGAAFAAFNLTNGSATRSHLMSVGADISSPTPQFQ